MLSIAAWPIDIVYDWVEERYGSAVAFCAGLAVALLMLAGMIAIIVFAAR